MRTALRTSIAVVALLVATGCGGTKQNSAGEKVFSSADCGSCHTLSAAKSKGVVGPNLDQLKPDYDTVVRQVSNGGNGMPAFSGKLDTTQIRDVAEFIADSTKGSKATVPTFHPDKQKLADCDGDVVCFRQAFGNISYYDGPKKALSMLDSEGRKDPAIQGDCHQIAHEIGHAAYVRYHSNAALALGNGSMTCWSGYYHGVIERAFGGVPRGKVAAKARHLCVGQEIRRNSFVAYQCVHGLGHGLMIYSDADLPFSLKICDELATQWDQTSCTGGVFMQNLMPMQGIKTKWLRPHNPLYPCTVVAQRDKLYCYLMVTSRILPTVGYNWRKTARWCRRAERGWVATCFQSFGRDASGQTVQNPSRIVSICHLASDMERQCVYGAARDLTSNDANGLRAARMCQLAPLDLRSYCFYGIGTILGGFKNLSEERRAECAKVTRRYLSACSRGAGV